MGVHSTQGNSLLAFAFGVFIAFNCVSLVGAQPPRERDPARERGSSRERDPFFLALREVHMQHSPDRELYETLLKFKNVDAEIGLKTEDI